MYTIGGFGIVSCDVLAEDRGIWTATVEPTDDATLADGQAVDVQLGTLTLRGTVIRGGADPAGSGVFVVGGRGGWRRVVPRRQYRAAGGVRLSDVLRDLATETGEDARLDASLASVVLGAAWTRPECQGAAALAALGYPWRVMPDGGTLVGPLPEFASSAIVSLRKWWPDTGAAVVELPDDDIAGIVPGAVVSLGDVSLTVRSLRVLVAPGGTVRVEVAA